MAPRRFQHIPAEAEEVRSRLRLKSWRAMSVDVNQRLFALQQLIGTGKPDEIHRHVIVSSIAALQTFHRGTIISIVDSADEFKARAAENVTEKISMKDALEWLGEKTTTFGELVAHSAPCNSVQDLVSWLERLLQCDLTIALAAAIDPYDLRNGIPSPKKIVPNVGKLLANLAEAFELRHIFAHEAASDLTVDTMKCRALFDAIKQWIEAIDAVLWATVRQNLPLTQAEMNQYARSEVSKARDKLASELRRARAIARAAGNSSWLRQNHSAWKKVTYDWAKQTYGSLRGSMWPAVGGSDLARAINGRVEQLNSWNVSQEPQ